MVSLLDPLANQLSNISNIENKISRTSLYIIHFEGYIWECEIVTYE